MAKDQQAKEQGQDAIDGVFGSTQDPPQKANVPTGSSDSQQADDHDNTTTGERANRRSRSHDHKDRMDEMIDLMMDTPINPRPDSKPPLNNQKGFYISAETEEMLDAAVTVLKKRMDQDNRKEVTKSLVAEIALRAILFDFADNREESHFVEWFENTFGPAPRK